MSREASVYRAKAVLIVSIDPEVHQTLGRLLRRNGVRVIVAVSEKSLKQVLDRGEQVMVGIIDVDSVIITYSILDDSYPNLKVFFISDQKQSDLKGGMFGKYQIIALIGHILSELSQ